MQALAAAGITSLASRPPTLEALFLRLYEADARPASAPSCAWPCAATAASRRSGSLSSWLNAAGSAAAIVDLYPDVASRMPPPR